MDSRPADCGPSMTSPFKTMSSLLSRLQKRGHPYMLPSRRPMWLPLRTSHMLMSIQSMCRLLSTTRTSQPRPFQDLPAFIAVLLRLQASPFPLKVCAQCEHALFIRDIRQSMCILWIFQNLSSTRWKPNARKLKLPICPCLPPYSSPAFPLNC